MRKNIILIITILGIIGIFTSCSSKKTTNENIKQSSINSTMEDTTNALSTTNIKATTITTKIAEKVKSSTIKSTTNKKGLTTSATTNKPNTTKKETTKAQTTTKRVTTTKKTTTTEKIATTSTALNISEYETYAKNYGKSIGMKIDSSATSWDNPISVTNNSSTAKENIRGLLDWYKERGVTSIWVYSKKVSNTKYNLYITYA